MEASTSYFVRACKNLTQSEEQQVLKTFADKLHSRGICKKHNTKVCDIKDMAIICGRITTRRRKRGVEESVDSVDIVFKVNAHTIQEKIGDCEKICRFLRIPNGYCPQLCKPTYKRFLKASVMYAKRQLEKLYKEQTHNMKFSAVYREFEPDEDPLKTTDVIIECDEGMEAHKDTCSE